MQNELQKAEQLRANLLAKEQGDKARRLGEELTPYIREMEEDFLGTLLNVDLDDDASVSKHLEEVRTMQNLNKLQDKIAAKITAGTSAAQKVQKNSR